MTPDVGFRRPLSTAALVLAAAALAWALVLAFIGGFEFELPGLTITSYEPMRPLAIAAVGLVMFTALHGVDRVHSLVAAVAARVPDSMAAAVLAVGVTAAGIVYNSTAGSGPDQYGYVSQADLWIAGDLHVPQPWARHVPWPSKKWSFAPLGYKPVDVEGRWENVPTYSPGLPLLMAAAKLAAGQEAVFVIVPIAGGLMVLATWGIGRRLGSSRAGLIGAWLVATSPAFLLHLVVPMSDVAAAAAWTCATFLLLGRGTAAGAGAGLAAGVGLMIRPNLAPLAAILALWPLIRRGDASPRVRLQEAAAFCAPVAAAAVATGAIYNALYGSPFISGYGRFSDQFAWANVLPNIRNYFAWFVETQTIFALAGLGAVIVPLRRVWRGVGDRRVHAVVAAVVLATWAEYVAYLVFDNFRYLRFLLVTWPFVMVGMGMLAVAVVRTGRPAAALAAAGLVVALGVIGWRDAARAGAFTTWRADRRFVEAALLTRDLTPPNSAVLTMIHSGSLRYYGGRTTIRYDILDEGWLDRGVAWLAERGVPTYALLEEWELEPFQIRFAGERLTSRLEKPIAIYRGNVEIGLYDLSTPLTDAGEPAPALVVSQGARGTLRSWPPAPAPALVFTR